MAQGRGSVNRSLVLGFAALIVMAMAQPTLAAVYYVNGAGGWTYNVVNWNRGKIYRAGDILVFKYNKSAHNLVAVSGTGYNTCTTPYGSRVYRSGMDYIKLVRGMNYFICSVGTHCKSNMKLAVKAY